MDETTEVELHGGPLDGQRVPVLLEDDDPWIAVISDHGTYPGGRSLYAPDPEGVWRWVRDLRHDEL
ncbi:hypothetical protein [Streptomyces sp. NPDC008125]|uniref:hypothetical protein n=1 Tax=Streptomyces sp. NPDC008125 TaxID=3364811 RepID=UPI0036E3974A